MADVIIVLGSKSDLDKAKACAEILQILNISYALTISSAHRSPERTEKIVRDAEAAGVKIFVCAAGMAAHLAGAVAARTVCPVIGIPISGSSLGGQDALLSTVQMPAGIPVATVALDKAGAKNAAWLAAEILALSNGELRKRLLAARQEMREAVEKDAKELDLKKDDQFILG